MKIINESKGEGGPTPSLGEMAIVLDSDRTAALADPETIVAEVEEDKHKGMVEESKIERLRS